MSLNASPVPHRNASVRRVLEVLVYFLLFLFEFFGGVL